MAQTVRAVRTPLVRPMHDWERREADLMDKKCDTCGKPNLLLWRTNVDKKRRCTPCYNEWRQLRLLALRPKVIGAKTC